MGEKCPSEKEQGKMLGSLISTLSDIPEKWTKGQEICKVLQMHDFYAWVSKKKILFVQDYL